MLNQLFQTVAYLAPWLIPTVLFTLSGAFLFEYTRIGDILIDLLRRISGRK